MHLQEKAYTSVVLLEANIHEVNAINGCWSGKIYKQRYLLTNCSCSFELKM